MSGYLSAVVRNFERDANGSRKVIRELVERDPDGFFAGAVEILRQQDDSRGSQFLIAQLVANDLLLRALCEPGFSREQAMELARAAARVDPMTDVALAKRLADSAAAEETALPSDSAARLMEILAEISEGARILPSLMRLMRHSNPFVRSKAVKLVGKGSGSVKWVRGRLAETDPRIRANAIEALWGIDNEEVRELLRSATKDGNNRVAGNALAALYRLGECAVIPEIVRMTDHGSALFRTTAAWVMGETGDPRFTELLARMMREPNAAVRARAMASLGKIKTAVARSRQGTQWLATGLLLEADPQKSLRRLQLAVMSEGGAEHQRILPTQFLLTEGSKNVLNYKVTEQPSPEAMSVSFVFPRHASKETPPWASGGLNCREWKRTSDLWSVDTYAEGEGRSGAAPESTTRYSANLETLTVALTETPKRSDCVELWRTLWSVAQVDQSLTRGKRHMIVVCNTAPERSAGDALVSAVIATKGLMQVISTIPNPKVEDFCRRAGASFQVVETEEAALKAVELAYLNLLARYEISYQRLSVGATKLKVRVNSSEGWAETSFDLPAG